MEDKYEVKTDEYGTVKYFKNNKFHREDGPAIEDYNGSKMWFINGKRHRECGPAIEYVSGSKMWFINGKSHREDGPAIEYSNGERYWYINDISITKKVEEWITSNNIPVYTLWTNKEIALFKLKFL